MDDPMEGPSRQPMEVDAAPAAAPATPVGPPVAAVVPINGLSTATTSPAAASAALVPRASSVSAVDTLNDGLVTMPFEPQPRTGYVYDPAMSGHASLIEDDDGPHPEAPERISCIFQTLKNGGCIKYMKRITGRRILKAEVELIHSEAHYESVVAFEFTPESQLRANYPLYERLSVYVNNKTPDCAALSAGGVVQMTKAVIDGQIRNGFAIVRPPGHHAEPEEIGGFCFYNNVSIATRWAMRSYPNQIKKVMILDWDVHHGNGTQRAFYDDPNVLYVSIHRYEGGTFYPSTNFGGMDMVGAPGAEGTSVNVPWPVKGMGDADYIQAFHKIIMPIAYEFSPDLIIISAGFDAAEGDHLGENHVSPAGFAHMTHMLSGLADGKLVVALEGGYNLEAISTSALAVTKVLLGEAPPPFSAPLEATELASTTIQQVALTQSAYWKSITPRANEPVETLTTAGVTSVSQVLKDHRTRFLCDQYDMFEVPLVAEELRNRFGRQVFCTSDIYDVKTLVFFVHDFGNLLVESRTAADYDVNMERSFLIDSSRKIVDWVRGNDWGLMDVNVLINFAAKTRAVKPGKETLDPLKHLVQTLWDNYIDLMELDTRIILVGFGTGCTAITKLIEARSERVKTRVKAVLQVTGVNDVPRVPKVHRDWYYDTSYVLLPRDHDHFESEKKGKTYGRLVRSEETRTVHLLHVSMDDFQRWLGGKLAGPTNGGVASGPAINGTAAATNGGPDRPAAMAIS